jgi:hypothetical protein
MSSTQLNRKQKDYMMFTQSQVANVIYKVTPQDEQYSELGKIVGNRLVKPLNVSRLKESMIYRNFLNCIPIIITKDGRIIDGQHRYQSATSLGIDIYVVIVEDEDVGKIAIALNTNKSNWGLGDFARYWSEQDEDGKVSDIYKQYLEYYNSNNITHGVLIAIYNMETSRHFSTTNGGNKEFKEGRLPFGNFNRRHIEDTLSKIRQVKDAALHRRFTSRTARKQQFQEALLEALSKDCFKFDRFLSNLCRSRHRFNELAKKADMYSEIIRIEKRRK